MTGITQKQWQAEIDPPPSMRDREACVVINYTARIKVSKHEVEVLGVEIDDCDVALVGPDMTYAIELCLDDAYKTAARTIFSDDELV